MLCALLANCRLRCTSVNLEQSPLEPQLGRCVEGEVLIELDFIITVDYVALLSSPAMYCVTLLCNPSVDCLPLL